MNPLIEAFEGFLKIADVSPLAAIGITHLSYDDVTLILKDKNNNIGGHFTVFSGETSYENYNIGEFTGLLFWCIKKGWKIEFETKMKNTD